MDQKRPIGIDHPASTPAPCRIGQAPATEIPMTRTALLAARILLSTVTLANAGSGTASNTLYFTNGGRVELFVDPTSGAIVGKL